ncbi:GT2 family glycosyltransferase [Anaerospora hongkongensis]|uniref:GT2 family glycosyltransferase n=1 Tax=Anaerospora hongkongensis TaxID=244830 RepID=A0A4R1Q3W7_9FIRM|nr:glycosyltransferase family 2 protein [Anaerospora hongkongensis]TCL36065.1 GT2 family glycosyltransferase [Anaerospora hongkongensis]
METVGVVVLNFNNYKDTIHCVEGLFRQKGINLYIVIVDNCSTNESYLLLKQHKFSGPVRIILNKTNAGYAAGNNVGLKEVADLGIKWSLILNPDTYFPSENAINTLLEDTHKLRQVGVIGPQVLTDKGRTILPYFLSPNLITLLLEPFLRMALYPIWSVIGHRLITLPIKVYRVYGCCMFGATEIWKKAGFLDEVTFLYWEEAIFSHRLAAIGFYIYYTPRCTVVHCHEVTLKENRELMAHEFQSMKYFLTQYLGYGCVRNCIVKNSILISSLIRRTLGFLYLRLFKPS